MRIGITFDLKSASHPEPGAPDDLQEEFDSPVTIEAISNVLRGLGHEAVPLGDGPMLVRALADDPPDFIFNMAEGQGIARSREARVPALCEMLGIPYTGSDPLTLAVTLDKDCARRLAASYGIAVPDAQVISGPVAGVRTAARAQRAFPVLVKPAWEGSSKGITRRSVVDNPEQLCELLEEMRRDYVQPILVEEYIEGDELTVGILGNETPEILGVMRVIPRQPTERFVYSLEVKRDYLRQVEYECPAPLPRDLEQKVRDAALMAYKALGCRDVARVDFRLRDGIPYFLEVNPLPGLNPESSDLVILAKLVGWTHARLIEAIVTAAWKRTGIDSRVRPGGGDRGKTKRGAVCGSGASTAP